MTPFGIIRKLGKLIRGGAGTPQLIMGAVLGTIIGMVPGFNMTIILAVVLLLVLNANVGLAIPGFLIGKALCYAMAAVTFRVGYTIIHNMGMENMFRAASETPVLALMDLHYYCVAGGLPIAIVLGLILGLAAAVLIRKLRAGIDAAVGKSDRAQRLGQNAIVRIILRLVFGKQKKTLAEMLGSRQPIFHKGRIIFCAVLIVLLLLFQVLFLGSIARSGIKDGLEMATGAEVDIDNVDVGLFTGEFGMDGVQLTDPAKPTHNTLQFAALSSDISTSDLLAGRFVVNKLVISGAKVDIKRLIPGHVIRKPDQPEPPITDDTVSKYFEDGRKIIEYLKKLKEYLEKREEARGRQEAEDKQADKEKLKQLAEAHGYHQLSAKGLLAKDPAVIIRELEIKDIVVGGKTYAVTAKNLSESPELSDSPMTLAVSNAGGFEAKVTADLHRGRQRHGVHSVHVFAPKIPLGKDTGLTDRVPFDLSNGTVDAELKGWFNAQAVKLPVRLRVSGLQAGAKRGFLGLSPETSGRIMKHLTKVELTLSLQGPLDAPRVILDDRQLLDTLKKAMKDAAQAELAGALNNQLENVLKKSPLGKLPGKATDLLPKGVNPFDKLLPGKKKDDKKPAAKKPTDPLKRLFE